jgi:probable selenium-dependent hydroxylase accessory protein YqeC
VTTTSTRLAASETRLPPVCLAQADGQARLAELRLALRRSRHVLAVREIVPELDLAGGLPLAEIEQIAALPEVDALIVEADGSRKRPLKAPAVYEPVMPGCATLVIPVVGLDVLGCPLTDDFVHRPQLVANLAGVALGQPITETIVSAVIGSQQGGAKAVPPAGRVAPFLNKAENQARRRAAHAIAEMLLQRPWIERVVVGAAAAPDPVRAIWRRSGLSLRVDPADGGYAAELAGLVDGYLAATP